MPGGNTTSQQQSSTSAPWAPSQPLLNSIISSLGTLGGQETRQQRNAAQTLTGEAASVPSFGAPAAGDVTGLLGGGGATSYSPMLNSAYGALSGSLSPLTNPNTLNPSSNPWLGPALSTMNNDITNQINSQFAAAGRDLSPANTTALARGLSQGEGGLLAGQYNTNVGNLTNAANSLFGGGNTTATGLTGFNQLGNQNILSGIGAAGAIPGLVTAPGATQLGAANTAANLPYQNMGWLSSLALPYGALGGTSAAQGTTTQQLSPWSNIIGGGLGGLGLLGSMFAAPAGGTSAAAGLGSALAMLSDERTKENIAPVGWLFDSTPVYSYNYKFDPTPRIGVMAQDVEQIRPDAVVEFGPARIKAVDYGKATERSREIGGMLSDMLMAA